MSRIDPDEQTRRIAGESLAVGDPTAWFERLYAAAEDGEAVVPWDRGRPHPLLVEWAEQGRLDGHGKRAVVIGCGMGNDAEHLSRLGFATTGFDIAPTAIVAARARFPTSPVTYVVADLLDLPVRWWARFDLVVEIFTVQALPVSYRRQATHSVRSLVAPGGTLLVIAAARASARAGEGDVGGDTGQGPPWPLSRREVDAFAAHGVEPVLIEDIPWPDGDGTHRWRAEFRRGDHDEHGKDTHDLRRNS